jgi:predicted RecB family endonuclease
VDLLLTQVKEIQVEQIKHYAKMDNFNSWSVTVEKTASELQSSIRDLTSRITTLEAATLATPKSVPPREEEGRTNCHDVLSHQ